MLGAVGFLVFLWSYPTGHNPSPAWLWLVSNNWAPPSVTATTLIIRLAAAYQAVVTIDGSAKLSSIRPSNAAPSNLLRSLNGSIQFASIWGFVAIFLAITISALQLASTALVRDMSIGQLVHGEESRVNLAALFWDNHNLKGLNDIQRERYWLETTKDLPTFADRRSPFLSNIHQTKAIRETGLVHRAFILFRNSTVRTSLKDCRGLYTVVDSRVACVQPKIHLLMTGCGWYLNGNLVLGDLPEATLQPRPWIVT
ncbi:uncharacterized protein B0J16DRAFT_398092 [Fusarium flagelliforme]|uniref:uncharacterized protein n=1 Tax=Fusarium flagelliforme TaxID=2675880 RepID=UPI001E8D07F9|nr:uncharacterized protein B0J16DRAFT_398092 [Fusarium flagelliforme]KAH7184676.1 hypothetical protein B0J16DRAFT_398092 [Fusarium flagelliforme]